MQTIGTPAFAALPASAAAGPVFVLSTVGWFLYAQLPQPIVVRAEDVVGLATILIPATIIGFLLAYFPNLLGSLLMSALAKHWETAREPLLWAAAGALAGAGIAALVSDFSPGSAAFPLIITSVFCAWTCRRQFEWVDEG